MYARLSLFDGHHFGGQISIVRNDTEYRGYFTEIRGAG